MKTPNQSRVLKIGALAAESGLSVRTLRHYEELGIISAQRTAKGTREYCERDIATAKATYFLRCLNVPVESIRRLATVRAEQKTGDASSRALTEDLETIIGDLRAQADLNLKVQQDIADTIALVGRCRGCRREPSPQSCPTCPLETTEDVPAIVSIMWR